MKIIEQYLNEMMKEVPSETEFTTDEDLLRYAIQAELDAVNLYEFLARKAKNKFVKKVLLDISREEKTHISEFEILLDKLDKEYREEKENAKEELNDMDIN